MTSPPYNNFGEPAQPEVPNSFNSWKRKIKDRNFVKRRRISELKSPNMDVDMPQFPPVDEVYYEEMADGRLTFSDGTLPVSRALLAFHCPYFMDAFFGPSPKKELKIKNYSSKDFKTFLDCLLGVKQYSFSNAITTYSIAHEYRASEALKKYHDIFDIDKVCDALNHNLLCSNYERVDKILTYAKGTIGILKLIETGVIIQPIVMSLLLDKIQLNSLVWIIVYEWSKKKSNMFGEDDIRSFLEKNNILSKLKLSHFESVQSILDFQTLTNWELLDFEEFGSYLENNLIVKNIPLKSQWFQIEEPIIEKIELKNSLIASGQAFSTDFNLEIWANQIFSPFSDLNKDFCVEIKLKYNYRTAKLVYVKDENFPAPDLFPLISSDTAVFSWKNFEKFLEEPAGSLVVNVSENEILIVESVEIMYDFKNFREFFILKSSLDNKFFNADGLFFTRNVSTG